MSVSKMVLLDPEKYKALLNNQISTRHTRLRGGSGSSGRDQSLSNLDKDNDKQTHAEGMSDVEEIEENNGDGYKWVQNGNSSYNTSAKKRQSNSNKPPPPPGLPTSAILDIFNNWVEL